MLKCFCGPYPNGIQIFFPHRFVEGLGQGAGCEFVIFMGMGDGGWGRGDVGGVMEEIWMSKYGG